VTVLADGAPYSLFGVSGEPAHRLAGWFLAVAGDQAGWDADRRAIAAELAAAAAGYRARHEEARRAVRAAADDALARVLARPDGGGPADPEIAAALRRCGLAPGLPLVAVALTVGPAQPQSTRADGNSPGAGPYEPAWPQVARVLLEEMLPAPVAGVPGCEAVALVPGGGALGRIEAAARALAGAYGPVPAMAGALPAARGTLSLAFGVSVLAGPGGQEGTPAAGAEGGHGAGGDAAGWTVAGIGRVLAQASQARRVAALLGAGVRVVDAAGLGSVELLLATAPAEATQAFRASLLSPLLDYDAAHGTELVRTLRVFLDCSGSWTKAAEAMFVHVNSLRYRMRRVEDLTGRDLGSLADQAALLLALRLAEDHGADLGGGGAVEAGRFPAG